METRAPRLCGLSLGLVSVLLTTALFITLLSTLPRAWPVVLSASLSALLMTLLLWLSLRALIMGRRAKLSLPGWWSRYGTLALFLITFAARLAMMCAVRVEPVSDYQLYYERARTLAAGETPWDAYIIVIAPNTWAYIETLACWMRLFGTAVECAQVFTALCFSGMVALFYEVARRMVSPVAATLAALWVSLSPETLFYTLHLGNEPLAMFWFMLGFLALLALEKAHGARKAIPLALGAGGALALCEAVRPIAVLAFIPLGIRALLSAQDGGKRRRMLCFALSIGAFAALNALLVALRARSFQCALQPSLGWTLYEGLDLAGGGQWTAEKSATLLALLRDLPMTEVQPRLLQLALQRVRLYSAWDWVALAMVKLSSLWGDSAYVSAHMPIQRFLFAAISTFCLWAQCLFLCAAAPTVRVGRSSPPFALCLAPVLLLSVFCLAGTSIARYHFVALPFMALSLAMIYDAGAANRVALPQPRNFC